MDKFREDLATRAKKWTEYVNEKYSSEIWHSMQNTKPYDRSTQFNDAMYQNERLMGIAVSKDSIILVPEDSVSAVFEFSKPNFRTAVLNFASFSHPGGKFLDGSTAQEEALCHESTLFPVLEGNQWWYYENKNYRNNYLYDDRLLYSPDIVFEKDGKITKADVITCAAPNMNANTRFGKIKATPDTLEATIVSRATLIIKTARDEGCTNLILGAWGCGVFKCPPNIVCNSFIKAIYNTPGSSTMNFIFAIPKDGKNYPTFESIFKNLHKIQ